MEEKITNIVDVFLIFLLVICSLHCLASSFDIRVNSAIITICAFLFTTVFALLAVFEKSTVKYVISLCVIFIVFVLMVLFSINTLSAQLNYSINCVMGIYSRFLPVAEKVKFSSLSSESSTALFVALSVPISGLLTTFIMRVRLIFPAAIVSIITITPCFILVNTLPDLLPLLTMFTILFTLFLSSPIHRTNPSHSGTVKSVVFVLMSVLATVVYLFNPVEGYERSEWQDDLLELTKQVTAFKSYDSISSVRDIEKEVDLSNAGPLEKKNRKVMTVTSPYSGKLYLKGMAYANYENNTWSILTDDQTEGYPVNFQSATMTKSDNVTKFNINIITEKEDSVLYTPYFLSSIPASSTNICDILIKNDTKTNNYDITFQPFVSDTYSILSENQLGQNPNTYSYIKNDNSAKYASFVYANYLSVPENTKKEMIEYAKNKGFANLPKGYLIDAVEEHVTNSANYSLKTERVPYGKDISTWLLNESNTGYCVHFATSAAIMLRSLEIPARYVTGYCVETTAETPTIVSSDNAHAWVEYFDDDIGWVPLDATPADSSILVETTQPAVTTQTDSVTTTQPTTDTQPMTDTQTTNDVQPTNVTKPTDNPVATKFSVENLVAIIIAVITVILFIILCLLIRRIIILFIQKQCFSTGRRNNRTKHLYRYLLKVYKYSHVPIPEEIEDIAEKARFSNSRINQEELNIILSFTETRRKTLMSDASYIKKLYFRYILVLA